METNFIIYSKIQAFVEHKINVAGEQQKDTLFVNVNTNEPRINISIENETSGENADFSINSNNFQQIVDWLRVKGIIN